MSADELGRKPYMDELVIISGEAPIYDQKYDYPAHRNYKYTNDYCKDIGIEDGSVFDTSLLEMPEDVAGVIKSMEVPKAIPEVIEGTRESFISAMHCTSENELMKQLAQNEPETFIPDDWDDEDEGGFYPHSSAQNWDDE